MSDKAKKSSEKSTSSSSERKRTSNSSQSVASGNRVPNKVTVTDIAEQICFWSSQTKSDNTPLVTGVDISKEAFGKPRRLYSQIEKSTSGNNFNIKTLSHKFPIREIFLVKSEETHTVNLPGIAPQTFKSGVIHINASDLELSRRTASGEVKAQVKQEASFNITTGEIELRLKQEQAGILYQSKYKVEEMFSPSAKIKLNPYTTEPTKLIQPIKRTKTFLSKLDKKIVNIYAYLNSKATGSPDINFNSILSELKAKLDILRRRVSELKSMAVNSNEQKLEIVQFNFIEKVLGDEESLANYKKDLTRWYENYKSWANRQDLVAGSIENHQYILEFKKVGKSRLSKYMESLANRTMKYDSRIVVTEDSETITDYTQRETAEREYKKAKDNVSRIEKELERANGRNNQVEIARLTDQLKQAKQSAKPTVMERMQRTDIIKSASGFGLYPPYLLSDMLRYGSTFMKTSIIDGLALSSENIETFAGAINGFKSLVFNVVSLYNQLAIHQLKNAQLCTSALNDVADTIINVSYTASLYPQLNWLLSPSTPGGTIPSYNITSDISQPLRFLPCQGVGSSFNILAESKPEYQQKTQNLLLLGVDEPVLGNNMLSDGILDFDLIYSNKFKSGGILTALVSMVSVTLSENFRKLLESRYDYAEDILVGEEVVQGELIDEDFPEFIESKPTQEAVASVNKWAIFDISKIGALASLTPEPQVIGTKPLPLPQVRPTKPKKEKSIASELMSESVSEYEDQDWTPVIINKTSKVSTTASVSANVDRPIPIKQITRAGKVKLADGETHGFVSNDMITLNRLEGENIEELNNSNWLIDVEQGVDTYFYLQDFNVDVAPNISRGFVTKIPDELMGSVKVARKTDRDVRDKHVESQSQFKKRRATEEANKLYRELGFRNVQEYLIAMEREENRILYEKFERAIGSNKAMRKILETLSEVDLTNKIKSIRDNNKSIKQNDDEVFDLLSIDEFVKVFKFYLENPTTTANIREVFAQIDLPSNTVPLHERKLGYGKGTTNGVMEQGIEVWKNKLRGIKPESSSSDGRKSKESKKGSKKFDKYEEKYLKYKAKYLKLKTELEL